MRRRSNRDPKIRKDIFQSLDSQSPGRKLHPEDSNNSAAIISVDSHDPCTLEQPRDGKLRTIRVKPVVVSDSSEDESVEEQITGELTKREKSSSLSEDGSESSHSEKDEKRQTVETSPESRIENKDLREANRTNKLVYESMTEKTEHYDYEKSSSSQEEQDDEEKEQQERVNKFSKTKKQSTSEKVFKTFVAQSLEDLLFSVVPKSCTVSCAITWDDGFFQTKKSYNLYLLKEKKLLISAEKQKISLTSQFNIYHPKKSEKQNFKISHPFAKLKSNFTGLQFVLQRFLKPEVIDEENKMKIKELLWMGYGFNMFGLSNERNLTVLQNKNHKMKELPFFSQIKSYFENGFASKFEKFENKKAEKNKKSGELELDFHDKAILPSGRNLILMDKQGNESLILRKKKQEIFFIDISYPFSLMEGFAIAIANLDRKLCVR